MGSASNLIIINDGENYGPQDELRQPDSDVDTEILSTPEFWANLDGESNPAPSNETAVEDLTRKGLDCIQHFEPCPTCPVPLEKDKQKAVGTTEDEDAHGKLRR